MLGIVLRSNTRNWFYENFINLCALPGEALLIEFTDIREAAYHTFLSTTGRVGIDEIIDSETLLSYIKNKINDESYSGIWVDEYHIPGTARYGEYHFVHTILIYGYDDDKRIFYANHFNIDQGVIKLEIDYEILCQSFFDVKNYYMYGGGDITFTESILCFKYLPRAVYSAFNLNAFAFQLRDYLFSKYKNEDVTAGIGIYDRFIYGLENNDFIPYRSLHTLAIHKKYLSERLRYISRTFDVSQSFLKYTDDYADIVKQMEIIRSLNLKQNIIGGKRHAAIISDNPNYIKKLISALKDVSLKERELLLNIHLEIKNIYGQKNNLYTEAVNENEYTRENTDEGIVKITFNEPYQIACIDVTDNSDVFMYSPPAVIHFNDEDEMLFKDGNTRFRRIIIKNKRLNSFKYSTAIDVKSADKLDFIFYKLPLKLEWNFNSPNWDWYGAHDIMDMKYENDALMCEISGDDPYIIANKVSFDADIAKYVYITMRTDCDSCAMQLFFTTENFRDTCAEASLVTTISPGDCYITYVFDMSGNPMWRGVVNTLRLDIAHYDTVLKSGKCYIKNIQITNKFPLYSSKDDFCREQGVLGWSYMSYNTGSTYRELVWSNEKLGWFYNSEGNIKHLSINAANQISCCDHASARVWTCPASGSYKIDIVYVKETMGSKCRFCFRRGGEILISTMESELYRSLTLDLKFGEKLSMEFHNGDQYTVETAATEMKIEKLESII